MPVSLYRVSIPPFISYMKNISACLAKGQAHASNDEEALASARLIGDMGNLVFQIQRISDTAKGVAQRMGKATPVAFEDNEKTFPDMQARLTKTIEFLEKLEPTCMDGMEDHEVVMGERKLKGTDYILNYAVPNFYFHVAMAYAIMRKEGVQIGKKSYLSGA